MRELTDRWPYCYHVTTWSNLVGICQVGALLPARDLLRDAGRLDLASERRDTDIALQVQGQEVLVRNQLPLDPAALSLRGGITLGDYVAYLNSMVFFWPGRECGPSADGLRMFLKSTSRAPILLRVRTASLVHTNGSASLGASSVNSGAAWLENGMKSVRWIGVFDGIDRYRRRSGSIAELSYPHEVRVPPDTTLARSPTGPWRGVHTGVGDML